MDYKPNFPTGHDGNWDWWLKAKREQLEKLWKQYNEAEDEEKESIMKEIKYIEQRIKMYNS